MSDTHSNAPEKVSDLKLEHLSDFDWNRCPIWFRTGVRHELESLSDSACSTQPWRFPLVRPPPLYKSIQLMTTSSRESKQSSSPFWPSTTTGRKGSIMSSEARLRPQFTF